MPAAGGDARPAADLHTHLLAGVDDGARTLAEARDAVDALRDQGVEAAVCTPHLRAGLAEQDADGWWARLDDFGRALADLRTAAPGDFRLERGVELRLDSPPSGLTDQRLRLAGGRYVLVEFASLQLPGRPLRHLASVSDAGWVPLLAHPERYTGIAARLEWVEEWREAGARLQVNAGSLTGQYGTAARRVAWALLERGWADVISSDYHARGTPRWAEGRAAVEACAGGAEAAARLFRDNPARVLADRTLEAVPPVEPPGFWRRLWSTVTPGG